MKWKILLLGTLLFLLNTSMVRANEVADYQRDLDSYRKVYKQFQIADSAYLQSQTFTAEEELVAAAQTMLVARADVWVSYWKLQTVTLAGLPSLSDPQKADWQQKLAAEVSWLDTHKERIRAAKTKAALLNEAEVLNDKADTYTALAFSSNSTLSIGRFRQAINRLRGFNAALAERTANQHITAAEKEVKSRGLTVNAERLGKLWDKIDLLEKNYQGMAESATQTTFTKVSEEGSPVYGELSQLNQVLHELSGGLEW